MVYRAHNRSVKPAGGRRHVPPLGPVGVHLEVLGGGGRNWEFGGGVGSGQACGGLGRPRLEGSRNMVYRAHNRSARTSSGRRHMPPLVPVGVRLGGVMGGKREFGWRGWEQAGVRRVGRATPGGESEHGV